MKRSFIVILTVMFFVALARFVVFAQEDNVGSLASQGQVRTCLHKVEEQMHPVSSGQMKAQATLKLAGTCESQTGCEIWAENSANTNIDTNEKLEKKFCNEGPSYDAEKCENTKQELNEMVEVDAKEPHPISNFTVNNGAAAGTSPGGFPMVAYGPVDISVSDVFAGEVAYGYYAVGDANVIPISTTPGEGSTNESGENPSQKEGTFGYEVLTPIPGSEFEEGTCVAFFWDPFGRVFDAKSLDPIPFTKVTLVDNATNQPAAIAPPFRNWDRTNVNNGIYNILTDHEGFYRMWVEPPKTHQFTRQVNIDAGYSKVYSDIYLPDDVFFEPKMPQVVPENFDYSKFHHDIPVMPIGAPYITDPSDVYVLKSSLRSSDMGSFLSYTGKATFPMAKICVIGATSKEIYGKCVHARKYGDFSISISKTSVPMEKVVLVAERVDLTKPLDETNTVDLSKVDFSDATLASIEPILSYIEGYARDESGNVIPSASVVVKTTSTNKLVSKTKADAKGYFTITADKLPFVSYYLEFTSPLNGKAIKQTTSDFVSKNNMYYKKQIDSAKKAIEAQKSDLHKPVNQTNSSQNGTSSYSTSSLSKSVFLSAIVITLIVLAIVLGAVLYIKQKKQQDSGI